MLKEKEKVLFEKWRSEQKYDFFISDGIFDEDTYLKQKCKILFVLKEANWEKGNADLCQFLLSESSSTYWTTWNNIARWTKAILDPGEYPRYVSRADKSYWLRKVAAMNLKKVGGDAVAEDETIAEYATRDRLYLKDQIGIYNPDIIICCGRGNGKNADILHDIVFNQEQVTQWQKPITKSKYNYFFLNLNGKKIPVLSFYHPQIRGNHEKFQRLYEEMIEIGRFFRTNYSDMEVYTDGKG